MPPTATAPPRALQPNNLIVPTEFRSKLQRLHRECRQCLQALDDGPNVIAKAGEELYTAIIGCLEAFPHNRRDPLPPLRPPQTQPPGSSQPPPSSTTPPSDPDPGSTGGSEPSGLSERDLNAVDKSKPVLKIAGQFPSAGVVDFLDETYDGFHEGIVVENGSKLSDGTIRNGKMLNCHRHGFYLYDGEDLVIQKMHFSCNADLAAAIGMKIEPERPLRIANGRLIAFVDCTFDGRLTSKGVLWLLGSAGIKDVSFFACGFQGGEVRVGVRQDEEPHLGAGMVKNVRWTQCTFDKTGGELPALLNLWGIAQEMDFELCTFNLHGGRLADIDPSVKGVRFNRCEQVIAGVETPITHAALRDGGRFKQNGGAQQDGPPENVLIDGYDHMGMLV